MSGILTAVLHVGGGQPFSASIPSNIHENTGGSTASAAILATVTGGLGPFTYLWEKDGIPGTSFADPTVNPVVVNAVGLVVGPLRTTEVIVYVTDTSTGISTSSGYCQVTFERT